MYIIKLNRAPDGPLQTDHLFPRKKSVNRQGLIDSRISRKDSFLSDRPRDTDHNQEHQQYSDSFREMMNKVLNRICKKNNFLKIQKRHYLLSMNRQQSSKEDASRLYQSVQAESRLKKISGGVSKLKIKGVGRVQNDSNLLKKSNKPRVFNTTSISFTKNKQFRKSIQLQKSKSLTSNEKVDKILERQKQNSSILNNMNSYTFNNSFYSRANHTKSLFDKSCKVASFIPQIQIRENYQKMQQVFKKQLQPKHKKIQMAKKLFHKKMVQRQRENQKMLEKSLQPASAFNFSENERVANFQPWSTHDQFAEDVFKYSKKNHQ